jgi:thiamine biosynthesis protein ThiS
MIQRLAVPALVLVTNRRTASLPLTELARRAVAGGVDVVQVREKDLAHDELLALCASVLETVGDPSRVMVNGSPEIARSLGIGVHLPENESLLIAAISGDLPRISTAVHHQSTQDALDRFDFAIIGHVFETGGKAGRPPLGLGRLNEIATSLPIDALAIGGMTPERVAEVLRCGVKGIAVMSAINDSNEPETVARTFKTALEFAMSETENRHISIQLNGKPVSIPADSTVMSYLTARGLHERLVVVELNGAILPRASFPETPLNSGDKVEIVHFVGGG